MGIQGIQISQNPKIDLLICENEPVPNVLKKLGLYYGKEFVWEEGAKQILLSGKLELKEDLNKVLHTIAFSFPVFFAMWNL